MAGQTPSPEAQELRSVGRPREQDEIAVGIKDNEVPRAPGFFLQSLMEAHTGGLVLQKKLFDLRCGVDGNRRRQKVLALAYISDKDRLANKPHAKSSMVTLDHAVERRVTINKVDREPEFRRKEIARRLEVGDIKLSFGSAEDRWCHRVLELSVHGLGSCFERLPSLETQLASYKLLRIAEPERCFQHLIVIKVPKPRQSGSDLGCDWMISITMPAQILLCLLLQVFEVWHGRDYGLDATPPAS